MHFTRLLCCKIPLRTMVRPISTFGARCWAYPKSVASRLIAALASWLSILQGSLHSLSDSKPLGMCAEPDVALTCTDHDPSDTVAEPAVLQPIVQSLLLLQGVALLHKPSKAFLGRRWCIQVFTQLRTVRSILRLLPAVLRLYFHIQTYTRFSRRVKSCPTHG
jgi:hypothetical protein